MKKLLIVIILLLVNIAHSQGRFIYKEGFAKTQWDTLSLDFYCWTFFAQNLSTADTLYITTDANKNPNYTIKIEPYNYIAISTFDGFVNLYIRSSGSNTKYKIITTTTGGSRR